MKAQEAVLTSFRPFQVLQPRRGHAWRQEPLPAGQDGHLVPDQGLCPPHAQGGEAACQGMSPITILQGRGQQWWCAHVVTGPLRGGGHQAYCRN